MLRNEGVAAFRVYDDDCVESCVLTSALWPGRVTPGISARRVIDIAVCIQEETGISRACSRSWSRGNMAAEVADSDTAMIVSRWAEPGILAAHPYIIGKVHKLRLTRGMQGSNTHHNS